MPRKFSTLADNSLRKVTGNLFQWIRDRFSAEQGMQGEKQPRADFGLCAA
jgi:hypothetical protein